MFAPGDPLTVQPQYWQQGQVSPDLTGDPGPVLGSGHQNYTAGSQACRYQSYIPVWGWKNQSLTLSGVMSGSIKKHTERTPENH